MTLDLSTYSQEQISIAIDKTIQFFSTIPNIDMSRLDRQINVTKQILEEFRKGKKIAIIDAPTGFGKSILGFFIHFCIKFLTDSNKQTNIEDYPYASYILTSNKFLQDQYLRDIIGFKFDDIKMLKGQSNYTCALDNVTPFPKANCKDESVKQLMSDGANGKFPCYNVCSYLKARYDAINANSTIFNYAYFLTTMNFVTKLQGSTAPFPIRDLTIFDECHVMGNIVSDTFSLQFNPAKFIRSIRTASSVIANQTGKKDLFEKYLPYSGFEELDKQINILCTEDDYVMIKSVLEKLSLTMLDVINDFTPIISPAIAAKDDKDHDLTDYEKYLIEFSKDLIEPYSALSMQLEVYDKIGFESAVISYEKLDTEKNKYLSEENLSFLPTIDSKLTFECTNESEMVKKYALDFTNYSIFMSATIGRPQDYAKRLNLDPDQYAGFEVSSDFDYSKSPIYKVHPMISMSHRDKATNMPSMMNRIKEIINHNVGVRGLIHTGNFEIMKHIKELHHPRILTYSNSAEKETIIKLLESRPDAIVAGPSLIEGIDLKDDLCRFMIYAKVPYLSLGSKLVKRKMELYDGWYNFQTLVSFQQGLGRPIRNKTDWCKTYLLDKSFESFFGRAPLPHIIADRLVETEIDTLDEPMQSKDDEFEEMMRRLEQS